MISSTSMHRGAPCTTVHHDLCAPGPWCITAVVHRIVPCTTVRDRPCAPALRCIIATLHQGARCSTMCDPVGPTSSSAAAAAATSTVAADGAADELVSPTSGRAGRVRRWGMSGSVQCGQGERRDRCGERAGPLRACEGGRGVRCSHLPSRSRPPRPRRQHEDEVDPAGLEVRGQGEGPDPDDHCTWPCARLEERLRNCWAAPRGTAGQKHAELMRQRRARLRRRPS